MLDVDVFICTADADIERLGHTPTQLVRTPLPGRTDGHGRLVFFPIGACVCAQANIYRFLLSFFSFAGLDRTRNRPGFDCHDSVADILVLFDVDWAVDDLVPDGRVVGPVHHVNLDFDRAR